MSAEQRLDELLNSWSEEKSLSGIRAREIRDSIVAGEVSSGGQDPSGNPGWWFKLYEKTTVNSMNRVNAAFDYGFKSA